jgi:tetratricopeptide (TPR) repeat protein
MERQLYLDRTMVVLARALARIGEVDQAVALAEALTSRAARATALAAVASSLALTGDWARARAVAETIQPSTEDDYQARIVRLSALAAAQARAHERELLIGEASALLAVIKHDFDKVRALGRVAQVLLDAGEPRRGLEMARQALALAQRLDDHQARQPAMDTVLLVLADAGDREQALELARRRVAAAESAEDKLDRSALLSAAAAALSSAGLRQEAITALRSLLTIARSTPGGDFGEPLLDALAALVSMFSSSKQARELQELCTAIVSVETWW